MPPTHLELWQPSNEGAELILGLLLLSKHAAHQPSPACARLSKAARRGSRGWQAWLAFLYVLLCQVCVDGRVKLGLQEGQEEVQEVDEQGVADWGGKRRKQAQCYRYARMLLTNVPSLSKDDSEHEQHEQACRASPATCGIRRGAVEEGLYALLSLAGVSEQVVNDGRRRFVQVVMRC